MLPFLLQQKDDNLQAVNTTNHDEGNNGNSVLVWVPNREEYQVYNVQQRSRLYEGGKQVNKHHKAHTKATESTEFFERDQFNQIMHAVSKRGLRRVYPSSSLGQDDAPFIRTNGFCTGISSEFGLG